MDSVLKDENGKELRKFRVGNLFKAVTKTRKVRDFEKSKVPTSVCNTPSTSATTQNNMIGYYVSDEQHNLNPPGITVTANGDGFAAWQPMSTAISQDSYYLVPLHEEMTESVQKYILVHLVVLLKKYNFNSKSGWAKVKNDVVSLPIDDNGDLDWEYMESYIPAIEHKYLNTVNIWTNKKLEAARQSIR